MKNTIKNVGLSLLMILFVQTSIAAIPSFGWVKGSGTIVTETRDVSSFHGIEVGGAFEIVLIKAAKEKLELEMDDNLLALVTTKVHGGILVIDQEKDFRNPSKLKITVYYKNLDSFDISGAASLFGDGLIKADEIEIEASGASDIDLKIETGKFEGDFSGASKVELTGTATQVEVETSGATVFQALDLETEDYDIDASGASVARIWVTRKLSLEASGASSIKYKGSPSIDLIDVSGAASIRKY